VRSILKNLGSTESEINYDQKKNFLEELLSNFDKRLKRVLLIPPDFTRYHSNAGEITQILYNLLEKTCTTTILPALGTHSPLTKNEIALMFGDIPKKNFTVHDWRRDVVKVGTIPSEFVKEISEDNLDYSIAVELNRKIINGNYDLILSIGQVVPHEVAGMANGNKNIFVGVGGSDMINKSHFLSACVGIERIMGRMENPVRELFNYAESNFLKELPLIYILTVLSSNRSGNMALRGLFTGNNNHSFKEAAKLSQKINVKFIKNPIDKIIVHLSSNEFKSTWLGNKAIYRTRMAIKDNGELIILAPGVKQFGEDKMIDHLIRKYGYCSSSKIISEVMKNEDLQQNLSAAAHLIHGSSENRFTITYCPGDIARREIEGVNYRYADLNDIMNIYNPHKLVDGYNQLPDGEEIFFISNPAIGLWTVKEKFKEL
jgi:nickel-dependent lactate racemase